MSGETRIERIELYLHDREVETVIWRPVYDNRFPVRRVAPLLNRFLKFFFLVPILLSTFAVGADLKPETIQEWEQYVKAADARNADRLAHGNAFLASDDVAGQSMKLRTGAIVVVPAAPHVPLKVHSGLIHDWMGAAFIPDTTLDDVLPVLRDYDRYKNFYHPNVVDSRRIATAESQDQFSMIMMNKSVVGTTALDADYQATYTRIDDRRWYSVADAIRIQEVADYETPSQHMLPENHGTGLIWRLHSVTRFEERDGGVYIEVEAIALSRDIPAALRWAIDPMVRRVSRSSVTTSLQQTESAVRSHSALAGITPSHPPAGAAPAPALVRSFR